MEKFGDCRFTELNWVLIKVPKVFKLTNEISCILNLGYHYNFSLISPPSLTFPLTIGKAGFSTDRPLSSKIGLGQISLIEWISRLLLMKSIDEKCNFWQLYKVLVKITSSAAKRTVYYNQTDVLIICCFHIKFPATHWNLPSLFLD